MNIIERLVADGMLQNLAELSQHILTSVLNLSEDKSGGSSGIIYTDVTGRAVLIDGHRTILDFQEALTILEKFGYITISGKGIMPTRKTREAYGL